MYNTFFKKIIISSANYANGKRFKSENKNITWNTLSTTTLSCSYSDCDPVINTSITVGSTSQYEHSRYNNFFTQQIGWEGIITLLISFAGNGGFQYESTSNNGITHYLYDSKIATIIGKDNT